MAVDPGPQGRSTRSIEDEVAAIVEEASRTEDTSRTTVPPAFYNDDEPPEPPYDDPHWREFPFLDNVKSSHLLAVAIVGCLLFATMVHLLILLAPLT